MNLTSFLGSPTAEALSCFLRNSVRSNRTPGACITAPLGSLTYRDVNPHVALALGIARAQRRKCYKPMVMEEE